MGEPWDHELDGVPAPRPRGSSARRVSGEAGGHGEWAVASATHPGEEWWVAYQGAGLFHCFCPIFQRKHACKHTEAVAEAVRAEARQRVAASTPESRAAAASRLNALARLFYAD